MTRRIQVIPMNRRFTRKNGNPGLFDEIWLDELSGVLNRAISGWQRLQRRGHFKLPSDVRAAGKEWLAHANPLEGFLKECCVADPARHVLIKDLYQAYCAWAKESGITRTQQRQVVKRNLEHRGYATKRSNAGVMVVGLQLGQP
jgi:putative DNA primase/helicase